MGQQLHRCGIEVRTGAVDALHDRFIQSFRKRLLGQIMLVLADTDGFGIDLDQLGKRVKQSSADGNRTSFLNRQIREFSSGRFLGTPYGCACLGDNRVFGFQAVFADDFGDQLFAFTAGGAIADGDNLNRVFLDQSEQCLLACLNIAALFGERIDLFDGEHLSGRIDHREFAAVVIARVKTENNSALERCLQQQLFKVGGEDLDGSCMRAVGELRTDFSFDGREQQSCAAVIRRQFQLIVNDGGLLMGQVVQCLFLESLLIKDEIDADHLRLFGTVNRHDSVIGESGDLFGIIIVILIDLLLILGIFLQLGLNDTGLHDRILEGPSLLGIVRDGFGDDIHGALDGILDILHIVIDILHGLFDQVSLCRQREHPVSQRLQTVFDRGRGSGLFLLGIRTVDVLDLGELCALLDTLFDFIGQLALLGDQLENVLLAFSELELIIILLLDVEDLFLIESVCLFLAVAGDEGNGVAFLKKG